MIAILDYQLNNLYSVKAACDFVGLEAVVTSDRKVIHDADALILPGVGAYATAMNNLRQRGLDDCVYNIAESGRSVFGICLGMQLLLEGSEEFGWSDGLGLLKGFVRKIPMIREENRRYPVPHVGWNQLESSDLDWKGTILQDVPEGTEQYFVHSYYLPSGETDQQLSTTRYGEICLVNSIQKENVFGTQFHPERSGDAGLQIYENLKKQIK